MADHARASLLSTVLWEGGELPLMELATLWRVQDGHALRGTVVGRLREQPIAVRYEVACDDAWRTRAVRVELTAPPHTSEIRIEVENGRWRVDGAERADLAGLTDIDIQVTPATNTVPIRRLALGVGEEAEVTAAWLQFPALTLSPLTQRYRRVDAHRYAYASPGFTAELVIGEDGWVERYGSFWKRSIR